MRAEEGSFRELTSNPIDVFISYASEDRTTVERLAGCLEAPGWTVWWDYESVPAETWWETVERVLERAHCVVVVWSRRSVPRSQSPESQQEVPMIIEDPSVLPAAHSAVRRNILIPVVIDDAEPPLEFRHIQAVNLSQWQGSPNDPAIRQLVASVRRLVNPVVKDSEKEKIGDPEQQSSAAPEKGQAGRGVSRGVHWRTWVGRGVRIVVFATSLVILLLGAWAMTRWGLDELKASATVTRNSSLCEAMPGFGPEMIVVEGGEFDMGEESTGGVKPSPPRVTVKPFAVGTCEVTFEEYDRFAETTKRPLPDDEGWGRGRRPVINVSWDDAKAYAVWLSQQTGKSYRLPTEAEWEYAARNGGTPEVWAGTSDEKLLPDYAVYNTNRTEPVGVKRPNGLGLYDMSGNVWEWVEDCVDEAKTDSDCGRRVLRGGSWGNGPVNLRASIRDWLNTGARGDDLGFRLVQDISE